VTLYNPNIYILYDKDVGYKYFNGSSFAYISPGDILRLWEIKNGQHSTSNLENYWDKVLISLSQNNHPYLVWGPYYSASAFTLYRMDGGSSWFDREYFENNIYEFVDTEVDLTIVEDPETFLAKYKIAEDELESESVEYWVVYNPKIAAGRTPDNQLAQNYPNPFNPRTFISFSLAAPEYVHLKIYDILGREVKILLNQKMDAGDHKLSFDGSNLPSGIYIYSFTAGNFTESRKMQIIK
jgi:hypothetical protein